MKTVQGVGINDYVGKIYINGEIIKSYKFWGNMLCRCYNKKFQEKFTNYKGCTVCDEWLSFSNFKKWFDENYRFDLEEKGIRLELDKDLLVKGNKIYSPRRCVFIPKKINGFLTNIQKSNTSGYAGVYFDKVNNKWVAQKRDFETGKRIKIGSYNSKIKASIKYDLYREKDVEKAKKYLKSLGYNNKVLEALR